jgi:hypothetical protein
VHGSGGQGVAGSNPVSPTTKSLLDWHVQAKNDNGGTTSGPKRAASKSPTEYDRSLITKELRTLSLQPKPQSTRERERLWTRS